MLLPVCVYRVVTFRTSVMEYKSTNRGYPNVAHNTKGESEGNLWASNKVAVDEYALVSDLHCIGVCFFEVTDISGILPVFRAVRGACRKRTH